MLLEQQASVNALAVFGHHLRGEIIPAHQRAVLVAGATGIRHVQRMSPTPRTISSQDGVRRSVTVGAHGDTLILPFV